MYVYRERDITRSVFLIKVYFKVFVKKQADTYLMDRAT